MRLLSKRLDNVFLRVYLGVFAALIVLLLLSLLMINLANKVRLEAHQEQLLEGFFTLLKQQPNRTEQPLDTWLANTGRELGLTLESVNTQASNLSQREMQRLGEGRPLVRTDLEANEQRVYFALNLASGDANFLRARLQHLHQQQAKASALLLAEQLQPIANAERNTALASWQEVFNYPLELVDQLPGAATSLLEQRLTEGEAVTLFQEAPASLTSYVELEPGQWLKLGPIPLFNPYPFSLLASVLFTFLLVLGLTIWWFLHGLAKRLRSLERVSSQLAAGNLKARVTEQEKDFIGKLASTFNHMAEQIQRLLRTQQEMIHAVSHELRTPVARIRFGLQMIEDLSEEQRPHQELVRQVQGIDKDIDELDTLIDEILTYARLGQEKLQLQFVEQEVIGLLEDVLSGFQRVNPNLHLELKVENPERVSSEADLEGRYFQRAIQNLVGNAVRYAKTQIRVTCHLEADNLRVDVEDDGPGIPEEDWQRVFMPFSRLDDSRTRSSGGYGLGLSIVQRIIYWHRGSALVDRSPLLRGARFSLIFPKQQTDNLPPLDLPPQ
ncbi:two-component system, OmpR family, sensor histidine kinase RstB [Marinospirillum celere]|uniref:histidine kinase n=1 Tax=Marinospirillum celere TaxID=1122252 RepID=A0A1I1JV64_9GAMM|nr:ATP-binding protein [Marinospirillum celere]SFC49693.1 two-component system, OmpR family, sensor histidine kinase RstB [Marinospirillum celere]